MFSNICMNKAYAIWDFTRYFSCSSVLEDNYKLKWPLCYKRSCRRDKFYTRKSQIQKIMWTCDLHYCLHWHLRDMSKSNNLGYIAVLTSNGQLIKSFGLQRFDKKNGETAEKWKQKVRQMTFDMTSPDNFGPQKANPQSASQEDPLPNQLVVLVGSISGAMQVRNIRIRHNMF